MIGRLDAPGAKLDPVMPGLFVSKSPSVDAPLRRISSFGTTVTVANWSVTIGSTPCCDGALTTMRGCSFGVSSRAGVARAACVEAARRGRFA
jgi:hypothetical protein